MGSEALTRPITKVNYSNKVTAIEVSPKSMHVSNSAMVTPFLGRVVKKKPRYFTARLTVVGQLGQASLFFPLTE